MIACYCCPCVVTPVFLQMMLHAAALHALLTRTHPVHATHIQPTSFNSCHSAPALFTATDPGPGPGEHQALLQPIPGPSFSFAAPKPGTAGKPTLAQLQQKLARLLSTHAKLQQQGRVRRGGAAAAGGGGGNGGPAGYRVVAGGKGAAAGKSLLQQEDSWDLPADVELTQRNTLGSKGSRMTGTSSVHNSNSSISSSGSKTKRAAGQVSVTRHATSRSKEQQVVLPQQDSTHSIPAPGDYYSSSTELHGPAYSMSGRAQAGSSSSAPGPGQYDDSKPFPHPLGRMVTAARPILKHSSSGGGASSASAGAADWAGSSRRSGNGGGQGLEGTASLTGARRRVSWADEC